MSTQMARGVGGVDIQAVPLAKSSDANLDSTAGAAVSLHMIFCVTDGDIVVTWPDSATAKTLSLVAGDCFTFPNGATVDFSATAGVFHKG